MIQKLPRIGVFDLEVAGVQGLKADRGILTVFGFKWLGEKKKTIIKISDSPGYSWATCQDDKWLIRQASEYMGEAEALVAHFGEYFDQPYLQAKLVQAGCSTIPPVKLTDTCLLARKVFALSSYRLENVGRFLECELVKARKEWPEWWMGALRGDKKAINAMAKYCGVDVDLLEQVYMKMRRVIPTNYLPINAAIGESLWTCAACGGHAYTSRGSYYTRTSRYRRVQCKRAGCLRWDHLLAREATVPKTGKKA